MNKLALLKNLDPPDLTQARAGYEKAAAGNTNAMYNLGHLLAELDPPDLAGAQTWWKKAAEAGDTGAMSNLGVLHKYLDHQRRQGRNCQSAPRHSNHPDDRRDNDGERC